MCRLVRPYANRLLMPRQEEDCRAYRGVLEARGFAVKLGPAPGAAFLCSVPRLVFAHDLDVADFLGMLPSLRLQNRTDARSSHDFTSHVPPIPRSLTLSRSHSLAVSLSLPISPCVSSFLCSHAPLTPRSQFSLSLSLSLILSILAFPLPFLYCP